MALTSSSDAPISWNACWTRPKLLAAFWRSSSWGKNEHEVLLSVKSEHTSMQVLWKWCMFLCASGGSRNSVHCSHLSELPKTYLLLFSAFVFWSLYSFQDLQHNRHSQQWQCWSKGTLYQHCPEPLILEEMVMGIKSYWTATAFPTNTCSTQHSQSHT